MNNFGSRIKRLRTESGLSGTEFGKMFNISKSGVSSWEVRDRFPSEDTLKQLASYFDVSIDYLLGASDVRKLEQIKINDNEVKGFTVKLVQEILNNNVVTDINNIPSEIIDMIVASLKNDIRNNR